MDLFARFICKWTHPDHRPERVGGREFEAVEARLGLLPRSYKQAVLRHGLPHPASSLPYEIVNTTEGWRDFGLPAHLVAFASDCLGNLFCFEAGRPDQDAVWLFDHDFNDFSRVAPSFRDWIASYCEIASPLDAVRA
jgi:hypothetical protein